MNTAAATSEPKEQRVMMLITIEGEYVTRLRNAVIKACGKWLEFVRVQPVPHSTLMRVWLGLGQSAQSAAMRAIVLALPEAEIGRIQAI
ncbi:MAG: hypothetical protein P4L77_08385 [Sulfuriferula sp.]|nr:hypothetical protein [Sulfuriferula sp.]